MSYHTTYASHGPSSSQRYLWGHLPSLHYPIMLLGICFVDANKTCEPGCQIVLETQFGDCLFYNDFGTICVLFQVLNPLAGSQLVNKVTFDLVRVLNIQDNS